MTQTTTRLSQSFPTTARLSNNRNVTLRLMTAADGDRILAFARSLPEEDLLFLRIDITQPDVVSDWTKRLEAGSTVTLIAEVNGEMAGYGNLLHGDTAWQRHLGEIRLLTGRSYRGLGLGRILAEAIFRIARELDLSKLTAQMTLDQKGAIAIFEKLGFRPEALLQDFVIDRAGRTGDLVVMTHDVTGLTDTVD
jgi:RimJ/RimL family protein N-acetyltransferase